MTLFFAVAGVLAAILVGGLAYLGLAKPSTHSMRGGVAFMIAAVAGAFLVAWTMLWLVLGAIKVIFT